MPNPALILNGQPTLFDFVALADTNTTILAKSGYGFLHALTVTGGTAGSVILYDNTEASGTIIASFAMEALRLGDQVGTSIAETFLFDIAFQTGLVASTTAVDTPRLSIAYK